MPRMTGARYLAEAFAGYGVSHVFFVPTILSATLVELERRTGIKRILTHGEKAAAYMADGYARARGRPGVCLAQTVGAANLMAGLRDAYLACSPVIAITGGPYPRSRNRRFYQEIQDQPLFKPVTKFSADVDDIRDLSDVVRHAFRVATTGTPGPVHIQLEGHEGQIEAAEADIAVEAEPQYGSTPPFRPAPDPAALTEAARLLGASERPIILAGGGVRTSGAGPEIVALAERLGIPIATSLNAKDTVPGNHSLLVGIPGLYSRKCANRAVLEADLVFFVGSRTGSQVTNAWTVPPRSTPVMQLDINSEELGRHYPAKVVLLGDAKVSLARLVELADADTRGARVGWLERVRALQAEWRSEVAEHVTSDSAPMRPERVCRELSRHLPGDALVVSDTGHAGMWTCAYLDLDHPGQGYIRAAGSLGWGLPAAIGAKLAQPDRPVVLFSGDGGFWYHIAELETAVRWNVAAVFLVNNNRSLNQEIETYQEAYGGKLEGRHGDLWRFGEASFADIARSMGAEGLRVTRPAEFAPTLERALAAHRPCVVELMTDVHALAPLAYVG